jgi:ABC-type glycerol-3-phosphate transport system substrate-binding protein
MLKKNAKICKMISLVVCILFVVALMGGCVPREKEETSTLGTTEDPTTSDDTKTTAAPIEPVGAPKPSVLEITRELYFGDVSDNPDMKQEFMEEFEKKFGVKLKVNYYPKNEYMTKVNLAITAGEISGLVNIYGPASNVVKVRDDGVILPLDDLVKDNEHWIKWQKEIPSFTGLYKLPDDNKTWALPQGFAYNFFDRAIRKDWLDKLNLPVPESLDDLYVVAKAFTENDPDGNNENDTFGLVSAGTWNLQDIFSAHGCRLDNVGGGTIAFDMEKMAWVDNMFHPEMPNALAYLKDMYANGYLDPEVFVNTGAKMREKFYNGIAGSWFYWWNNGYSAELTIRQIHPDAEVIEVPAITGPKKTKINHYAANGTPFILLKNTKEPKETVHWFINLILANEEAHWWCRYGTEKYNRYDFSNKMITREIDPKSATGGGYPAPALIGDLPWFTANNYIITTGDDPANIEEYKFKLERKMKVFEDGKRLNLLYEQPFKYDAPVSETYTVIKADIAKAFDECIFDAVTGNKSIEDAISTYRATVKALGAQNVLDEANASVGTSDNFKY